MHEITIGTVVLDHGIIPHVASMPRVSQPWAPIDHLASHEFNHHSSPIQALTCPLRPRLVPRIEVDSH